MYFVFTQYTRTRYLVAYLASDITDPVHLQGKRWLQVDAADLMMQKGV